LVERYNMTSLYYSVNPKKERNGEGNNNPGTKKSRDSEDLIKKK